MSEKFSSGIKKKKRKKKDSTLASDQIKHQPNEYFFLSGVNEKCKLCFFLKRWLKSYLLILNIYSLSKWYWKIYKNIQNRPYWKVDCLTLFSLIKCYSYHLSWSPVVRCPSVLLSVKSSPEPLGQFQPGDSSLFKWMAPPFSKER